MVADVEIPAVKESYCQLCVRRVAVSNCYNADCRSLEAFSGCDSCYECVHKPACDLHQIELLHIKEGGRKGGYTNDVPGGTGGVGGAGEGGAGGEYTEGRNYCGPAICVVCEEKADQKCIQCQDM